MYTCIYVGHAGSSSYASLGRLLGTPLGPPSYDAAEDGVHVAGKRTHSLKSYDDEDGVQLSVKLHCHSSNGGTRYKAWAFHRYVCVCTPVCVCTHTHTHTHIHTYTHTHTHNYLCICMHECVCVCVRACVRVCVCAYVHTYRHI